MTFIPCSLYISNCCIYWILLVLYRYVPSTAAAYNAILTRPLNTLVQELLSSVLLDQVNLRTWKCNKILIVKSESLCYLKYYSLDRAINNYVYIKSNFCLLWFEFVNVVYISMHITKVSFVKYGMNSNIQFEL